MNVFTGTGYATSFIRGKDGNADRPVRLVQVEFAPGAGDMAHDLDAVTVSADLGEGEHFSLFLSPGDAWQLARALDRATRDSPAGRAIEFVRGYLRVEPHRAASVIEDAARDGMTEDQIRQAAAILAIRSSFVDGVERWEYETDEPFF